MSLVSPIVSFSLLGQLISLPAVVQSQFLKHAILEALRVSEIPRSSSVGLRSEVPLCWLGIKCPSLGCCISISWSEGQGLNAHPFLPFNTHRLATTSCLDGTVPEPSSLCPSTLFMSVISRALGLLCNPLLISCSNAIQLCVFT